MSKEKQTPENKEDIRFLDLDEGQFGTIVYLSSASHQMGTVIGSKEIREEMLKLIESGNYKTVEDAISWIRGHRNNLLKLNTASTFALNLLNQVEDLVVDKMLSVGNETAEGVK